MVTDYNMDHRGDDRLTFHSHPGLDTFLVAAGRADVPAPGFYRTLGRIVGTDVRLLPNDAAPEEALRANSIAYGNSKLTGDIRCPNTYPYAMLHHLATIQL